jgi:hypothetical protein
MVTAPAHPAAPRPVSGRIGPMAGTRARVSGMAADTVQPACRKPTATEFRIDDFGAAVVASGAKRSGSATLAGVARPRVTSLRA